MKILSVIGYHNTGKTTLVVNIIKELKKRGFKVQSIKDIHVNNFTMETAGSDSWKHLQTNKSAVIARGLNETNLIWNRQLSLNEMLQHLDADYVIVEGMKTAPLPRILCAQNASQLKELLTNSVFAISGKFADNHSKYENLPVLNSDKNITQIVDLIEQFVFDALPLAKQNSCMKCGFTCEEMVEKILSGEKSREDCKTDRNSKIEIKFDGKIVKIVPHIQNTFADIIKAYSKNLKGYKDGDPIEIEIK